MWMSEAFHAWLQNAFANYSRIVIVVYADAQIGKLSRKAIGMTWSVRLQSGDRKHEIYGAAGWYIRH